VPTCANWRIDATLEGERGEFPTRPQVSHHSGVSPTAFLHVYVTNGRAAPLR
jgi:hypothetical protein